MLGSLLRRLQTLRLSRLKKRGLQIADDCRMEGMPFFGSEPFLISIGRHVLISGKVAFVTHDGGTWVFRDKERYRNVRRFGRITIHDNCFIGYGTIIMPGVSIGPNAVVGAHSVVTKDVPEGAVVGGVPARAITTVDEYAEKSLARNPDFDEARYQSDKQAELLRLFPYPW